MTTHLNEKLIAVEVPSDATEIEIGSLDICIFFRVDEKLESKFIGFNFKNLKIIGEVDAYIISNGTKIYFDYLFKIFVFKNKRESFRSLLQSKGIDTNKPNVKHVILEKYENSNARTLGNVR